MLASHPKPGRVLLAVLLATLTIFGGLVLGITLKLRERLREQVLRREAEAIHAVALMQMGARDRFAALEGEDGTESLFAAVLESSRLRGVMAVQLFDAKGELREALPPAIEESVGPHWWPAAPDRPEARFIPRGSLGLISPLLVTRKTRNVRVPLLDIAVPLRVGEPSASPVGVARYWIDGTPVAAELAGIDRSLALPSGIAFLGGSLLVGLVVAWASSRLAEANRQLVEQSADLLRANQELDFAAKTGALGAISAHLIHGLKNPLAGIEGFVTETAAGGTEAVGGDACRAAVETTRRLRLLVNEVIAVLRDETEGGGDYGVPVAEVIEAARRRAVPLAEQTGVTLTATAEPGVEITGRAANLAGLVLSNLLANAIEALPRRGHVNLEARRVEAGAEFLVSDSGPGLPHAVKDALFRPVRSAKRGGGGMGLAISHRLAKHAGGDLQLVRSGQQGTTFRLIVPTVVATVNAV
ncbi:MAG: HAMP domain-containing sensor histidine kinase [Opitutaceae bacterium]|nr:HAMP domain-containing sensor histidine kinase [Opitutaceae bacterium]